jgi:hypothetical protein
MMQNFTVTLFQHYDEIDKIDKINGRDNPGNGSGLFPPAKRAAKRPTANSRLP